MDSLAQLFTSVAVRVVARYLIAAFVALGLGTAAQGESLVGDPEVQSLLTLLIGGAAAWVIERATVLARRSGGKV